jgi:hypothetical protein
VYVLLWSVPCRAYSSGATKGSLSAVHCFYSGGRRRERNKNSHRKLSFDRNRTKMPSRRDLVYPSFSVDDEKPPVPAYESNESIPQTLSTADIMAPKVGLSDNEKTHADGYFDSDSTYVR